MPRINQLFKINYPKLALVLALAGSHSFAQVVKEKRHFVSLSGGAANPIGIFASVDPKVDNSGYAVTGYFVETEGVFYFIPYVGLGTKLGTMGNKIDEYAFKSSSGLNSANGTIGKWKSTYFMFGPAFAIPTKSITVDFKLFLGAFSAKTPNVELSTNILGSPITIKQPSTSSTSIAFDFGMGIRVNMSPSLALKFNLDVMNATPSFVTNTTATFEGEKFSDSNSFIQPMTMVNAGIGLAYQFVK